MSKLVKAAFLLLLVTVVSLGITAPVSADTIGPTFGNPVPADGKLLTAGSHLIEIEVSDPDMINAGSVEMLINGQKVPASTDYAILEIDPVSETETYDYTKAVISYRQKFSDNTYNVEVHAKDGSGNLSVKKWSFEVKSGPVFSSLNPASYSTIYSRFPKISSLISVPSGKIDPSGVKMKINGEEVPVFFDVFTTPVYLGGFTGEAVYTPISPLAPGKYTVSLTATDSYGKSNSTSWTFSVDYPVMPVSSEKQDCLKCHTNMPAQHKMSNCKACHDGALRKIYENTSPLPHFVQSSCFSCHETASHEAQATADQPAWYPIDKYYSCEQCHSHSSDSVLAKHQSSTTGNCQECHATGLTQEHFKSGRVDESGNSITCFTCHNSTNTAVKNAIASNNTACEACHTTVSHNAVHNNPAFTTLTRDSDMECAGCHKSSISEEHINGRFTQGLTCDSCHNSSRPEVKAAIANNNLNCEACHIDPVTNAPKVHTSSGPPLHDSIFVVSQESDCTQCHANNLKTVHVGQPNKLDNNNLMSCATCHESSNPAVLSAIKANNTNCDACHTARHNGISHTFPAGYVLSNPTNMNCAGCHQGSGLTDIHVGKVSGSGTTMSCNTCHSTTAANNVKTAVTNGQTNCDACHVIHQDSAQAHNNPAFTALPVQPDMKCSDCHNSSISDEHISGKVTSGKGYTCSTCHDSSRPEVKAAIANNNLNCEACHIDPVTNAPKVHTSSGPPLHDSIFVVSQESDCTQCHANNLKTVHVGHPNKLDNNNLMSCATCHESSNPAVLSAITANNTNCDACHTARHNGISHTFPAGYVLSNPTNMNCAGCHQGSGLTDLHVGKVSGSGATMSCNTCHSTTAADNVKTAVTNGQTNCDACHVIHQDSAQAHNNPAFTALPVQPDMKCSDCHNSSISDEHISGKVTSGKGYTCSTCHDSSRPEVKAAIANNNLNCEACHIDPVTNAPKVHTSSGPPLHDSIFVVSQESDCTQCHANNLKTVHVGQPNKLDNNNLMSCATCHESSNPAVLSAIKANNTNCDACHTARHNGISHTFPAGYVLSNPTNMNCAGCHQGSGLTDIHVGKVSGSGATMSCNTCHSTTAVDNVKTAVTNGQTNCDACHVIHQDSAQAHNNPAFTALPVQPDMKCSDCHNSSISDEHINGKVTSGKGYTCSTCHDSSRTEVKAAIANNNRNCEACHSSVHTSPNPYHATTFVTNKTMACEKCHNSGSIADDHAKYKTSAGLAITCQTCHSSTDSKVKAAIAAGNTGCDSCHASRHTNVQGPHKTTYIPNTTYNCISCHPAASIGYNQTKAFHRVSGLTPNVNNLHGGIFVNPWTATSNVECRGCHGPNPGNNNYYGKLLKGNYTPNTGTPGYTGSTELCFLCHTSSHYAGYASGQYGSGFKNEYGMNLHTAFEHGSPGCQFCHSRNVHSSSQQHFIVLYSTTEPASGLVGYEHEYQYNWQNSCGACHS